MQTQVYFFKIILSSIEKCISKKGCCASIRIARQHTFIITESPNCMQKRVVYCHETFMRKEILLQLQYLSLIILSSTNRASNQSTAINKTIALQYIKKKNSIYNSGLSRLLSDHFVRNVRNPSILASLARDLSSKYVNILQRHAYISNRIYANYTQILRQPLQQTHKLSCFRIQSLFDIIAQQVGGVKQTEYYYSKNFLGFSHH